MKYKVIRETHLPYTYILQDMDTEQLVTVDLAGCFLDGIPEDLIGKNVEINNWDVEVYLAEDCRVVE